MSVSPCECSFHDLDAIKRRFPLLIRAVKWAGILCDTEATAAIRDYKHGLKWSSEAVCNMGGTDEAIKAGIRCRKVTRMIAQGAWN